MAIEILKRLLGVRRKPVEHPQRPKVLVKTDHGETWCDPHTPFYGACSCGCCFMRGVDDWYFGNDPARYGDPATVLSGGCPSCGKVNSIHHEKSDVGAHIASQLYAAKEPASA